MIKFAALSITLLLVGCGTVPHIEEQPAPVAPMPMAAPTIPMAPPPPPPMPAPVFAAVPPPTTMIVTSTSEHAAEKIEEAKSTIAKIAKRLPKNAAVVVTEVASTVMDAAQEATTTSTVVITKYDEHGNVTEKHEEHKDSLMDFFNKLLDNMTKLIGLGTGALGLYVGFQKLRNPTVKPETA